MYTLIHKRKQFLSILSIFLYQYLAIAQVTNQNVDFQHYRPQVCQGPIPSILTKLTSSKAKEAMRNIKDKSGKRAEKRTEIDHAVESSFFEDQLLTSGQILYGDPMSEFVNDVADELLKDDQFLRDKLHFFVLKSHVPNAYTTHNGIVVVTIGLLARLENESQLAVILAHEIQHFVKNHSLKQYKEVKKTISDSRRNNGGDLESKLKRLYRFSKEQEYEADQLGYELLKKSSYDLNEGIFVFEMLKFTEYPFLETTMTIENFEKPNYKFPVNLFDEINNQLKNAKEFDDKMDREENDEETSTHPSLDKRIDQLKSLINKKEFSGSKKYIVGENKFKFAQQVSRFELLLMYVKRADFGRSYYLSKVVELLYGKSDFLNKVSAMSLYGILEHKINKHNLDDYGLSVNYNRGDWRPISAAFNLMDVRDFAALAGSLIYNIYKNNPSDVFVKSVCDRTFVMMQTRLSFKLNDFIDFKPAAAQTEGKPSQPVDPAGSISDGKLKNPRSRITRNNSGDVTINNVYYYGVYYHLDTRAKDELKTYFETVRTSAVETSKPVKLSYAERERQNKFKYMRENPDVNKLIVLQPKITYSFGKVDFYYDNLETKRNYFIEEETRNRIMDNWKYVSNATNTDVTLAENSVGKTLTTEDLNAYAINNDWLSERLNNDTNQMIIFYKQFLGSSISEAARVPYLINITYDYIEIPRPFDFQGLLYSVVYPIYFPFYLARQFQTDKYFKEKVVAYNTETGRQVYSNTMNYSSGIKDDFLRAHIYKTIYEMKHISGK